jgi:hypothetical protein
MKFRWVVLITLWTVFAGPIFAPPGQPSRSSEPRAVGMEKKAQAGKAR